MMLFLTRPAVEKFRELLDAAMCSRVTLVTYLSTLSYETNPALNGSIERDATGYILCPPRHAELTGIPVPREVRERFEAVARDHLLTPAHPTKELWPIALDAILRGILVPRPMQIGEDTRPALHPPCEIRHTGSARPMVHISELAHAALERAGYAPPAGPGRRPQFARILRRLTDFRYDWNDPRRDPKPYPRRRYLARVESQVFEYLASEGLRLGFPPHQNGRRTALAVASNVIEAIGQDVIIPVGPRGED